MNKLFNYFTDKKILHCFCILVGKAEVLNNFFASVFTGTDYSLTIQDAESKVKKWEKEEGSDSAPLLHSYETLPTAMLGSGALSARRTWSCWRVSREGP